MFHDPLQSGRGESRQPAWLVLSESCDAETLRSDFLELTRSVRSDPELAVIAKTMFPDDEHFDGLRTLQHMRQLNDQNIARAWASLDVSVLALFGEYDIRTLPMDAEYIAAIVNARHPGKGTWRLLPKLDHGFAAHDSLKDSVAHEFVGPLGDQVVQETVTWMREIAR